MLFAGRVFWGEKRILAFIIRNFWYNAADDVKRGISIEANLKGVIYV